MSNSTILAPFSRAIPANSANFFLRRSAQDSPSAASSGSAAKTGNTGNTGNASKVAGMLRAKTDFASIRKKQALQRVARLKQRLDDIQEMLRRAPLPALAKTLARELKSIARELASAAKLLDKTAGGAASQTAIPFSASAESANGEAGMEAPAEANTESTAEAAAAASAATAAASASQDVAATIPAVSAIPAAEVSVASESELASEQAGEAGANDADDGTIMQDSPAKTGANDSIDANDANDDKALREALREALRLLRSNVALVKFLSQQDKDDPESRKNVREAERDISRIDEALRGGVTDALYTATGSLMELPVPDS